MSEEALAGDGENYPENSPYGGSFEKPQPPGKKKQEDKGRYVCPWAVCVGQPPAASSLVALVMFLC